MSRILATGDWHVGSSLNLGRTPEERLSEQEETLHRLVDVALEQDVDLVLIGGDIWHRRRPTPAEMLAVARPLRRLGQERGIDVVAIAGNHDVEHADWPAAIEVFGDVCDVHRTPTVVETRACSVAVLPWTPLSALRAQFVEPAHGFVIDHAAELLVRVAKDLCGQCGQEPILLGHWSVTGASTPTGMPTDRFNEVVIPLTALDDIGFDAVVLSHVHKGDLLPSESGRPIFYTSSPFPVDFGEADTRHGCWILDVGDGPAVAEFVPLPGRRFVTINSFDTWEDADVDGAIVKVRGPAADATVHVFDRRGIEQAFLDAGAYRVIVEPPQIERASRARVDGASAEMSEAALIRAWCDANDLAERAEDLLALAGEWRVAA